MFSTWLFFHPFFRVVPDCKYDILKTNEPVLLQIGTSGQREGVMRSKVKVTQRQS